MLLSIAVITGLETLPLVLIPLGIITVRTKWNPRIKSIIYGFTLASICVAAALYLIYH